MEPTWSPDAASNADPVEDAFADALKLVQHLARAVRARRPPERADPWLSIDEAAQYAGVSARTVRRWIGSGELRYGRSGRTVRVKGSDIDDYYLGHAGAYRSAQSEEDERVQREVQRLFDSFRR